MNKKQFQRQIIVYTYVAISSSTAVSTMITIITTVLMSGLDTEWKYIAVVPTQ
jgi:hypothetical protein